MIKLKEIALKKSRFAQVKIENITKDAFLKLYDNSVKINKINIHKSLNNFNDEYGLVIPSAFDYDRKSEFSLDNFYSLLIDNLSSWKEYPGRSDSLIGTTSDIDLNGEGTQYIVIPLKNSKIGISSHNNISDSFKNQIQKYFNPNYSIEEFLYHMKRLQGLFGHFKETYNSIVGTGYKIDKNPRMFYKLFPSGLAGKHIFNGMKFMKLLNLIFNPKDNNFTLKTTSIGMNLPKNRDVWTDDKCLLVRNDIYEKMKNER